MVYNGATIVSLIQLLANGGGCGGGPSGSGSLRGRRATPFPLICSQSNLISDTATYGRLIDPGSSRLASAASPSPQEHTDILHIDQPTTRNRHGLAICQCVPRTKGSVPRQPGWSRTACMEGPGKESVRGTASAREQDSAQLPATRRRPGGGPGAHTLHALALKHEAHFRRACALQTLFAKTVGPVQDAFIVYNSQGNSKGMAVVAFHNAGDAAKARQKYNGKIIDASESPLARACAVRVQRQLHTPPRLSVDRTSYQD